MQFQIGTNKNAPDGVGKFLHDSEHTSGFTLVLSDILQQLVDLVSEFTRVYAGLVATLAALPTLVTLMEDGIEIVFLVILWDFFHGWQPFQVWWLSVGGGGSGGR